MKKIMSGLCASTVALAFGLAGLAPVNAAPVFVPQVSGSPSDIQNVQFGPDWRRGGNRAENPAERLQGDRFDRRGSRADHHRQGRQDRFERRGNRAYYNGHRGYDQPRRGYRQHNGVWFPAAAFIVGAIIGGALENQPRAGGNAHVQYCYNRYQSYRASDNSFQPYVGGRRQCVSS